MHATKWQNIRIVGAVISALVLVAGCTGGDDGADTSEKGDEVEVLGTGDRYSATIRRSEGGVAHITGASLADASFGQGWASGEDRACDLADQVMKVNGERARWLGAGDDDANIASDVSWRTIGIRQIAEADWPEASAQARELITAYTEGWNAQLEEVGVDGISDWCAGAEWVRPLEPVEVYSYARSIALLASSGAVASMLGTAQPPSDEAAEPAANAEDATTPGPQDDPDEATREGAVGAAISPATASNGWAIGSDRSEGGGGMLVANPHFPWEGELRFWEVHLTVPGEVDVYGVQLSGVPGVAIGFGEEFGWTHTVSAGNRFTAYTLDLVPGSPTTYRYGDETREMTSEELTVEVLGDDGEVTPTTHTVWRSHYGPVLDFPGVGWTDERTITLRDANIDNDEFIEQYVEMVSIDDLDGLIELNERVTGVPLFNTVAVSADGRAWYADTAATPALSDDAVAAYDASLESDPIVSIAADNGAVLLDGSDPLYEWQDLPGARDPGLVPFADMPAVERSDYVFNANDSFWMPHATEMLEGDYSPLHGRQRTPRSPRTRENATLLEATDEGIAGTDGRFSLDQLATASIVNSGYTARALRADVVQRCDGAAPVVLAAELDDDGVEQLPAATVDVGPLCEVLESWDGIYDIDRSGPVAWREFAGRFEWADLADAGPLWADAFDPDDPWNTPSGLAAADGGEDQVLVALARAAQVIDKAGFDVDVTLGEVQVADRNGTLVPIHGGNAADGTTNVVGWATGWNTLDPTLGALESEPVADGSTLATVTGGDEESVGYRINWGTSFLMALEFTDDGPRARTFLTYGNTADRSDPAYTEATERFSEKRWKDVAFTPEQVREAAISTVEVRG